MFEASVIDVDVMAGLVPAIYGLHEPVVKIVPFWVCGEYQANLSRPWPMLDVLLALDRSPNVTVRLNVDQAIEAVSFRETGDDSLTMLPDSPGKITGYAGVKDAVWAVRDDVDPGLLHATGVTCRSRNGNAFVDGRDKPGHDGRPDVS